MPELTTELALIVAIVTLALALGGFVKGATGAGGPLVAVPTMAAFYDVRMAVVLMAVPNIVVNAAQIRTHAESWAQLRKGALLSAGALPGVVIGTYMLATADPDKIALGMAVFVTIYIVFRLTNPQFAFRDRVFHAIAAPVGVVAGFMQGVAGLSGPLALALMNATPLERSAFIANISLFFLVSSVIHLPALFGGGLLTWETLALSTLATIPLLAAVPVGNAVGKRLNKERFNKVVLVLIALLAVRLYWRAFT